MPGLPSDRGSLATRIFAATARLALPLVLAGSAAATPPGAAPATDPARESSAWVGMYCTAASCRRAAPWNAAAFGGIALGMGWLSQRRSRRET